MNADLARFGAMVGRCLSLKITGAGLICPRNEQRNAEFKVGLKNGAIPELNNSF